MARGFLIYSFVIFWQCRLPQLSFVACAWLWACVIHGTVMTHGMDWLADLNMSRAKVGEHHTPHQTSMQVHVHARISTHNIKQACMSMRTLASTHSHARSIQNTHAWPAAVCRQTRARFNTRMLVRAPWTVGDMRPSPPPWTSDLSRRLPRPPKDSALASTHAQARSILVCSSVVVSV